MNNFDTQRMHNNGYYITKKNVFFSLIAIKKLNLDAVILETFNFIN